MPKPLVKAALGHVQFETIHPFLDGNGRVGRLLITLLLCDAGVLREPVLYLSIYFKQRRRPYYDLLDATRRTGDWEKWLRFFADAVLASAEQALDAIRRLHALAGRDRAKIEGLGRAAASALQVHRALQSRPITNTAALVAMVINLGAYSTEIVRAGVEAIPHGQIEAGRALGLRPFQIVRFIVLFPALKAVYPALTSQFILVLLGSSIVSAIAAEELTAVANTINSQTFRSFEIYTIVTILYVAIVFGFRATFTSIYALTFARRG